jgi:uncharacterized protein YoxC
MKEEILKEAASRVPELSMLEMYLIMGCFIFISALVALGVYIKNLHKSHNKTQNENTEKMLLMTEKVTSAMTNGTHAIENNNRLIDKLFDKIDKVLS